MIWLIRRGDGTIQGPLSTEELLQSIKKGDLSGEEMFSKYPEGQWKPLAQDPQFYDHLLESLEDEKRQQEDFSEEPSQLYEELNEDTLQNDSPEEPQLENTPIKEDSPFLEDIPPSLPNEDPPQVITLTKQGTRKSHGNKIKIVGWISVTLAVCIIFLQLETPPEKKNNTFNLIAPRKKQKKMEKDQVRQKSQKALKSFQLDTRWGYTKAQNELIQLIEGTTKNLDAYSLLCMTYFELWPYVKQSVENMNVISQVTQSTMSIDPTGTKGVTCHVVQLMIKGEYKKAKLTVESILNKFGSSNEILTQFYYFKAFLLANEGKNGLALRYLNSAQGLWASWLRLYAFEADLLIRSKQYEFGVKRLNEVIQSNPRHVEAKIRLGQIEYLVYQQKDQAKVTLMEALKVDDEASYILMSQAHLILAQIFLKENQNSQALESARKSYQWNSANSKARSIVNQLGDSHEVTKPNLTDQQLVYQGDQFVRSGNCHDAQIHYKLAYENNPKNAVAAMKVAKCLWRLNLSLEAIEWLNHAIVADPNLIDAYIHLADYYSQRYNYLAAMRSLAKAQQRSPRSYEIFRGYALVEKRRENYSAVIHFAKQALKVYVADVESLILLSEAYMKMRDYQSAYSSASQSIEMDSSNRDAQIIYGKSLMGVQGTRVAVAYLSDLVSKFPLTVEYRLALGEIFIEDERYLRAEGVYRQAIEMEKKSKKAFLGLGHALKKQEKFKEALDVLLQAALLDPSDPKALFERGLIYLSISKLKEAKDQFLRVEKINERFPWVYYYLGRIELKRGRSEKALRRAKEEKNINPHSPAPYLLAAEAYTVMEKYGLCAREYQKAIQVSSQNAQIYIKLARCYRQSGSLDVAQSMLEQAKELESGNPAVYRELGAIYESKGYAQLALDAYKKYLELAPNALDAPQITKRINDL